MSSCTEEQAINKREEKIEGTWKFDKATFREEWELFGDDMMYHFKRDRIVFYEEGTAVYEDYQHQRDFEGSWGVALELSLIHI